MLKETRNLDSYDKNAGQILSGEKRGCISDFFHMFLNTPYRKG